MPYCTKCGNRITVLRNGVLVILKGGSAAKADRLGCETCGYEYIDRLGGWLEPDTVERILQRYPPEEIFDFRE